MGTLAPGQDWQLFPFSTNGEVFRLVQTWRSDSWWKPSALLAQFWNGDRLNQRRIWATNGTTLEFLKIPDPFKRSGQTDRQIGLYLLTPYKPLQAEFEWTIELQVFDPGVAQTPQTETDGYQSEFGSADLLDGRLIVNHGLGDIPTSVQITDSQGDVVNPDNIRVLNDDTLEIDLRSFGTDLNDWDVTVET